MDTLFHATFERNVIPILLEGLRPSRMFHQVYMSKTPHDAVQAFTSITITNAARAVIYSGKSTYYYNGARGAEEVLPIDSFPQPDSAAIVSVDVTGLEKLEVLTQARKFPRGTRKHWNYEEVVYPHRIPPERLKIYGILPADSVFRIMRDNGYSARFGFQSEYTGKNPVLFAKYEVDNYLIRDPI
jgi:hypothetical protein